MFISTETDVDRNGLINVLNLYAYITLDLTDVYDRSGCKQPQCDRLPYYGRDYDEPLKWYFCITNENRVLTELRSKFCVERNDCSPAHQQDMLIILPSSNPNNDPELDKVVDRIIAAGGVHLPDNDWCKAIQIYIDSCGKGGEIVQPFDDWSNVDEDVGGYYPNYPNSRVKFMRRDSVESFEITHWWMKFVEDTFLKFKHDYIDDIEAFKSYVHCVSDAKDLIMSNIYELHQYIIRDELHIKTLMYVQQAEYIRKLMRHEFKRRDKTKPYRFTTRQVFLRLIQFLDSVIVVKYLSPPKYPYTRNMAQVVYSIENWQCKLAENKAVEFDMILFNNK
ncbi:ORF129 [Spodoptera frugiperda granulovirus]|uniref:ORF129 n=1 Tax=Spodoptera frugiperda granulovirus TaxID=307454 RepID=A0A0C5B3A2_9BBAC|nr:ORF129 [Spodoptera frugiperda granulovirus]AJK91790.1 ORF129 [Spodoptera frugiperda granulovirus]